MRKILFLLLISTTIVFSQENLATDYFGKPLDIPLILSGSFGELRGNHFHSGLDIKTQQREGHAIYATADGHISRINVQHYGYGKALYVLHPNNYSTVYAHLQRFSPDIEKYVKEHQYKKENFEIELFPTSTTIPVKKGELIGYSGNTGGSGGPHLHYEIRDPAARPMNPLLFGVEIPDSKIPLVTAVFAYSLSEDSHINQSQNPVKLRLIKQKDGNYKAENITAFGKIGFGISTYDQFDGAINKNGVYTINTEHNGSEKFEVRFDKFSFSETRYLNRYIDYGYWMTNKSRVQKLFRETNNPLSIITKEDKNGIIDVKDDLQSIFNIRVRDYKGNEILVSLPIDGKNLEIMDSQNIEKTDNHIVADHAYSITQGKYSVYIPANSLYEDVYLDIQAIGDTLRLHKDVIPIHKNISITADISNYTDADKDKLYIGRVNFGKDPYYTSTKRTGNKLVATTRTFGEYVIGSDFNPPSIKPVNFEEGKWISDQKNLKIMISDDLSGISSYRATINGKFILMEYEYKNNTLTYDFADNINTETENNLRLIVTDNVGNSATFDAKFFRKQS